LVSFGSASTNINALSDRLLTMRKKYLRDRIARQSTGVSDQDANLAWK
jgi:hypothetical protein